MKYEQQGKINREPILLPVHPRLFLHSGPRIFFLALNRYLLTGEKPLMNYHR